MISARFNGGLLKVRENHIAERTLICFCFIVLILRDGLANVDYAFIFYYALPAVSLVNVYFINQLFPLFFPREQQFLMDERYPMFFSVPLITVQNLMMIG